MSPAIGVERQMNKVIVAAVLVLIALGCAPKKPPVEYDRTIAAVDVNVEVNSETMTVSWKKAGEGMIAGYNIYISEEPLAARYPEAAAKPTFQPYNDEPFPGDTNPDDGVEYFIANNLENGVKYYVSVRVVYPDKSVSKSSNEVLAVCGPRGAIELAVRYEGEHDGFSFEKNEYVKADAVDNDVYFFSKRFADILNSPVRLNGFLRKNKFLLLPFRGTFEQVSEQLAQNPMTATNEFAPVKVGDWVLIQTPEKKNALVNVLGFSGEQGEERRVRLFYAYSALTGEIVF